MKLEEYSIPERYVYQSRRDKLATALNGAVGLICAGQPQPNNFRANTYHPFRASSHFLYLVGQSIPSAVLWVQEGQTRLYSTPPSTADALWHGPSPTLQALGVELGCEVRSIEQLSSDLILGGEIFAVPSVHADTSGWLTTRLKRTVSLERDAPLVDALIDLRLIHDEYAINELRTAVQLSVHAHKLGMRVTRPGLKASQIRAVMEGYLMAQGLSPSYTPIITPAGEVLHNHHHDIYLRDGDLLLVDFGAETRKGWAGDLTRTWPVNGKFSSTQRDIYQIVEHALSSATQVIAPDIEYREVHRTACISLLEGLKGIGLIRGDIQELLEANVHALFFPHGVGHLLGLDVHDMEDFGDRAGYADNRKRDARFGWGYLRLDRTLKPGMAVTVEPGFYQVGALLQAPELVHPTAAQYIDWQRLAHFKDVRGIRLEDDVLVTQGGHEVLSKELPTFQSKIERLVGTAELPKHLR